MKCKLFLGAAFLLLASLCSFAQTGTKVSTSWTPSISPGATNTVIYRGPAGVACPASGIPTGAAKVGQVSAVVTSFDDTTGVPKSVYCYYATALNTVDGSESVASNTSQATFPTPPLAPPTNFKAQ